MLDAAGRSPFERQVPVRLYATAVTLALRLPAPQRASCVARLKSRLAASEALREVLDGTNRYLCEAIGQARVDRLRREGEALG